MSEKDTCFMSISLSDLQLHYPYVRINSINFESRQSDTFIKNYWQCLLAHFCRNISTKKFLVNQDNIHLNQSCFQQNFFHHIFPIIKMVFLCQILLVKLLPQICFSIHTNRAIKLKLSQALIMDQLYISIIAENFT